MGLRHGRPRFLHSEVVCLDLAAEVPRRAAEERDVDRTERVVDRRDDSPVPRVSHNTRTSGFSQIRFQNEKF